MPIGVNLGGSQHALSSLKIPYVISDEDSGAAVDPEYFGFLSHLGSWYILENNKVNKTFRYASGKDNYPTNWTGRAGLAYTYYNLV